MRAESLSTANAGMTRLRRKGKASPATLYDCLNAYITIAGSIKPRPGTVVDIVLPAGTKGLVAHKGIMTVFSHTPTTIPDSRYQCITLRHPTDSTLSIRAIHFAKPFMGFLYVVAAFEDDSQYHYWAEELDAWLADTPYLIGGRVFPTSPNGFAYKATRTGSPNPAWGPGISRTVGDFIEPTVYNGFYYECIAVTGTNPASGSVEPDWPTEEGAIIIEDTLTDGSTVDPGSGGDGDSDGTRDIEDRYTNPYYRYRRYQIP